MLCSHRLRHPELIPLPVVEQVQVWWWWWTCYGGQILILPPTPSGCSGGGLAFLRNIVLNHLEMVGALRILLICFPVGSGSGLVEMVQVVEISTKVVDWIREIAQGGVSGSYIIWRWWCRWCWRLPVLKDLEDLVVQEVIHPTSKEIPPMPTPSNQLESLEYLLVEAVRIPGRLVVLVAVAGGWRENGGAEF